MSTVAESRVVEMRFDNKEFEANARETLNTLDELKRALETSIDTSSFDELDRAARNIDFSGVEAGIEALTDRFSTMGIVGMTVIQNITNALTNTLGRALNSVFSSITTGGLNRAKNIENARFQLQGILQDAEKVEEVMKNASDSVDGTAYALDSAAKAASQLAASGVEAGDQMSNVLKGIAGVAATTSTDYEGVSRIFTQIAGQGRLMGDQLLQLSNRGLNAAATLTNYINGVKNGTIEASDAVKEQIAGLTGATSLITGATEAVQESSKDILENAKKAANAEYKVLQKSYQQERKELQKELNEEYNIKKKAYDQEYKLRQTELNKQYKALQESLNAEVEAVQEANQKRLEEVQETYEQDVEAYRKATDERISLINEEYKESIKLIDEEKYEKLKAVDDKIKAIQDQSKAEQKALKDSANEEKRLYLQNALEQAKGSVTKQKAAEALAELEAQIAREQLAEDRANQIEELQNEKENIRDEYAKKKEEAQEKAQNAREAVQEESSAELKAMQKAHQANLKEIRKEQAEQISAMREANSERLSALKESQSVELETLREGQNEQLSIVKEAQQARLEHQNDIIQSELERFREGQNEQLEILADSLEQSSGKAAKWASKFGGIMDLTEGDLRDMVSDGLISFDLFSEAMSTTFGEHAYDANKTFEGALSNVRAALARTGAMFYTPLIEEGGPLVDLFNAIRVKINEVNKALQPFANFITSWLNTQIIPKVTEFVNLIEVNRGTELYTNILAIKNVMDGIGNVLKFIGSIIGVIVDAFKDLFNIDSSSFYKLTVQFKEFTKNLKVSNDASNKLSKTLKAIVKLFKSFWTIVKRVVQVFTPLSKLFGAASSDVLDMSGGVAEVIERFADWLETSKTLQTVFSTLTKGMELFVTAILTVRDKVKDLVQTIKSSEIGQAFANGFVEGIKAVASTVWNAITEFCKTVVDKVKSLFGIQSPSTVMYEIGENFIKGFINAITTLGKTILEVVTNVFGKVTETISNFFKDVNWKEMFREGLEASTNFVTQFAENIRNGMPDAINAITDFFAGISDYIRNRKDGQEAGEGFGNSFIEGIKNFVTNFKNNISRIFSGLFSNIHFHFDTNAIKEGLANGATYVVNFFKGIKEKLGEYAAKAGEWFSSFFSNINGEGAAKLAAAAAGAIMGLVLILRSLDLTSLVKMFKILKPLVKIANVLSENMEKITSSEKFQEIMEKFHLQGADTALNYVAGFINGLKDKIPELLDKVKELGQSIIDKIKEVLGIQSPSTVMYAIGGFIVAGLILGIANNIGGVRDKIVELFNSVVEAVKTAFGNIKDDIPSIAAVALGMAGFVMLIKLARELIRIVNPFSAISSSLTAVKKALFAYQMDLRADALLKVAEAVAILAGVILGLYEITKNDKDIGRLYIIAGVILATMITLTVALGLLTKILTNVDKEANGWFQASKGVKKALSSWGMSKVLEEFGKAMLEIILAIVVLAKMYQKYPDATAKATGIMISIAVLALTFSLASAAIAKETGEANTKINSAATSFLYIAAAMLTIINALQKLIDMKVTWEKDKDAILILGGILTALFAITIVFGKLQNNTGKNMSLAASSVLAFCIMLYVTILALRKIIQLAEDGGITGQVIGVLVGIFIALGILIGIMGKASGKANGLAGGGGMLLGACAVILVTIIAIYALMDMPLLKILKGVGTVALILLAIGLALRAAGNVKVEGFKSIIAIAATIMLLVAALGVFSKMDTKQLLLSAVSIAITLAALAFVFYMASKLPDSKGKLMSFLAMAVFLAEIAGALYLLSTRPWDQMAAAGGAMAGCILAFGRAIKSVTDSEYAREPKEFAGFLIASLSLIVIGAALAIAATQPWQSLLAAGGAISAVIIAYAAAFKIFSTIDNINLEDIGAFITGTLAILIISLCLLIAASQPWDQLLAAGTAISEVLLLYAAAMLVFGEAKINLEDVGNFILGTLSIIIVAIGLAIAASQPWDSLLAAGTAIGEVLDLYAVAMLIFSKANVKIDDVANFLLGCIGVLAVGYIVKEAASQNWKDLLGAGLSISVVLIAMAVAMLIATVAGTFKEGALMGIAVLDAFIADLVVVLTALGGLSKIPGFTDLIADGGALLVQIGTALGNFVGSIIGGALESISDSFPAIGTNLSEFIKNAQPFLDGINGLDESKVKAATALAGVMMAIGVAEFLDSMFILDDVLSLFTPSLADRFAGLGEAVVVFAEKTKDINGYQAKAAAEACVEMVGVMDAIKGRDFRDAEDLQEFGSHIAEFATECQNCYTNLGGKATVELYQNVAQIMKDMIGVVSECTNRDFRDGEQLPQFGNDLADFALDLRAVGSYAKNLVESTFETFYNCAKWVLQLGSEVPRQQDSNSFVGVFAGTNDVGEFGDKIKAFAKSIAGISDELKSKELSETQFKGFYNCSKWLLKIAEKVPKTKSGLSAIFSGNNDIGLFGQKLEEFATSLKNIQQNIGNDLNETIFENIKNSASNMIEIGKNVKIVAEDGKKENVGANLKNFGEALKDFGANIKKFGESANKGYLGFSGAIELLQKLKDMIPDLLNFDGSKISKFLKDMQENGVKGLTEFLNSFNNSNDAVTKAIGVMFSNIGTAMTSKKDLMEGYGRIVMNYFKTGIESDEAVRNVKGGISSLLDKARNGIDTHGMYEAGKYAVEGFVRGIRDNINSGRDAGRDLGNAAYEAAKKSLEERSPSKKMAQVGSFAGEGFVQGFAEWIKAAARTGTEVGESAQEGLVDALSNIAQEIQNEEDFTPIITPVLDLSNVEANARELGGILNLDKPLQLAANAGMSFTGGLNNLLSNIQASIPDNSNEDVVTAINSLRTDINILGDKVAAMQVVMDTGELVGSIATPVDYQLGFNGILAERGVTR